jgi:trimeric autotransporter adhesin
MTSQPHIFLAAWRTAACSVLALPLCGDVAAQCSQDWKPTDGFPGIQTFSSAYAVTTWDPDGAGPLAERLVAGGEFQYLADRVTDSVAAFNPEAGHWEDLGGGLDLPEVGEDGSLLDSAFVNVLGTFQGDLIVGGSFLDAGGVAVQNIARWDGESWSALGSGLAGFPIAMTVYDGELIVAGTFGSAGGVTVNNIARWNGASWQPLGTPAGTNAPVFGLSVYDGELVAAGSFTSAGGVPASRIARWNGSQWQPLGTGVNNGAHGLAVLGDDLYVGGDFTLAGGVPQTRGVARWDGASWHPVAGGAFSGVSDLIVYQGELIASGVFIIDAVGGQARQIARLDGLTQAWHTMEGGTNAGAGPSSMVVHGDELIAAGSFSKAGNTTLRGLARWIGAEQTWKKIAPGFDITPAHFTSYRGDLIAAGGFGSAGDVEARGVARWDGVNWHPLGGGVGNAVVGVIDALDVYDDQLIVGGNFTGAGGVPVQHIAAWDADTQSWSDVGGGVSGGEIPRVHALAVYDGDLIAAGEFSSAGGSPAFNIARWDGAQWHAMGAGVGIVFSMAEFNGDLYVSVFSGLDGMQRWDGSAWHAVPGGFNNFSMTVWDGKLISGFLDPWAFDGNTWTMLPGWSWDPDGAGVGNFEYVVFEGDLIVCGQFENAAGIPEADGLVRFDGTSWHSMATANGTPASITSGAWVHEGELITNGRVIHPGGSISNWRRLGWAWSDIGSGLAGVNGIPMLAGTGSLAAGCAGSLLLTSARAASPALLFVALSSVPAPFKGGVLVASPFTLAVALATNGSGALLLPYTWPSGVPGDTSIYLQCAVKDVAAPQGVSLSNALKGVTP